MSGARPRFAFLAVAWLCTALSAANASGPEDEPVYSLVAAREINHVDHRHRDCLWLGGDIVCPQYRFASYDEARTLAGPAADAHFSISTEVARGVGWSRPVLLAIRNLPDRQSRVVAAAGADASGQACIPGPELDRLGWHPAGPDIVEKDGGVCANLSALAALPKPYVEPVIRGEELLREQRKERRRQRNEGRRFGRR